MENACEPNDLVRPGLCTSAKKQLPEIRRKLRAKAPIPSYKELRRARESFYSSAIQDLYEEGYPMVAEFLERIDAMERELHAKAPEGLRLKHLYDAPEMLSAMIAALKRTEEHVNFGMPSDIVLELLRLGNAFAYGIFDFKWVAESVLAKALAESEKIMNDDGRTRATVLCFLGKLYAQNKFFEQANQQFDVAWDICRQRDWTVSKTDQRYLSRLVCLEYCSSLDQCAQELLQRPSDRSRAKFICDTAVTMAKASGSVTILADAYASYGHILSSMQQFDQALEMLEKCLKESRTTGVLVKVATAELNIANCNYDLKRYDECLRHAKRANKIAMSDNFVAGLARSHELMAHAERSLGNSFVASVEYVKASELYDALGRGEDMRKALCFAAVSKAQDMIMPFIDVVLKSDKEKFGDNKYMAKLLNWETCRIPFWDNVLDDMIVVSATDTTYSAPEEALMVPNTGRSSTGTASRRLSNLSRAISLASVRRTSQMDKRNSVFLECVKDELKKRPKSIH